MLLICYLKVYIFIICYYLQYITIIQQGKSLIPLPTIDVGEASQIKQQALRVTMTLVVLLVLLRPGILHI